MAQLTFLRASYTKIDHYQCHLMVFASNLGIVIVGVYSTMKCRLHPLSQVECCVSHLSCRVSRVASIMSHQPCRCYLRHVYPCDTYDRRHFKVYPTSDIFDRKSLTLNNVGTHILATTRHCGKGKGKVKAEIS